MKYTVAELDAMPVGTVLRNRRRVLWVKTWVYGLSPGWSPEWLEIEYSPHTGRWEATRTNGNSMSYRNFTHRADPASIAPVQGSEGERRG